MNSDRLASGPSLTANPGAPSVFRLAVVIVTHNSDQVLGKCVEALLGSSDRNFRVVIVDSGSATKYYLEAAREVLTRGNIAADLVDAGSNVGFAKANNLGVQHPASALAEFFLFLNPDAFVLPDTIGAGLGEMTGKREKVGAVGGWLYGFDLARNRPSGLIDSLGIARRWYGKWFDIGQGQPVSAAEGFSDVRRQAACGALMFCRSEAFNSLKRGAGKPFNEHFFMYKEDIELSLRLSNSGWAVVVSPVVKAYHCRGWSKKRSTVDRKWRLMSAQNEFFLDRETRSPYIVYSALKLFYVRFVER